MARIILADDDELICELVRSILVEQGHIVGVVANGNDALRAIWAKRPNLMILDCNMPDMTGINVLRQIRKDVDLYRTPVLMLTGRCSRGDEDIAMYEGANGYVTKPFEPKMFVDRVHAILERSQTPTEPFGGQPIRTIAPRNGPAKSGLGGAPRRFGLAGTPGSVRAA